MSEPWNHPGRSNELSVPSVVRRGRRPDVSSSMELLLALPQFLSSLMVVSFIGSYLVPQAVWLLPCLWVLSGAIVFVPAAERLFAQVKFGVREPVAAEWHALAGPWHAVCRAAGVPTERYSLWVEDSTSVNAFAAAGHIVAVTRPALQLPPHHLEAVLAHELGHHLAGHAAASLLSYWYAFPARLSVYVIAGLTRAVLAIGSVFARLGGWLLSLAAVGLAIVLLVALFELNPWLPFMPVISVLLAWVSRVGEKRADRTAAQLGYGPALVDVLHSWLPMEGGDRSRSGVRGWLFATHPPIADRINALTEYLRVDPGR